MSERPAPVVLVVEDEPLVRLYLADLLADAGFRVIEAVNAAEALTVLGAGLRVAVLLTDVDMPPGINGYELVRQVHRRWPAIEILITSGRQWPAEGDLPPGAVFLAKPCPNDAIVSSVRSAADRAEAARAPGQTGEDPNGTDERGRVVVFPKSA